VRLDTLSSQSNIDNDASGTRLYVANLVHALGSRVSCNVINPVWHKTARQIRDFFGAVPFKSHYFESHTLIRRSSLFSISRIDGMT
jgi:hypothetical protein